MRKYLSRSRDIAAGDCYQFLAFGGKYSGNNALDRDIGGAENTPTYGSLVSSMSRLHFPCSTFLLCVFDCPVMPGAECGQSAARRWWVGAASDEAW